MTRKKRPAVAAPPASEQVIRDGEVVRANRELAAYFKGRRTEREARAALKIIKAFVRDRERQDAKTRAPLPGLRPAKAPVVRVARKTRRTPQRVRARGPKGTIAAPLHVVAPGSPDPAAE